MVSFVLIFHYLQKFYFSKWVFSYSLKIHSTNTIFLFALKQVFHHYQVLLLQQGGLSFPIHFWHLYSIHINLSIQHFATDYGIISHQFPIFTIVLPWIGPFFMSITLICHCHPLVLIPLLFQAQGFSHSYFSRQTELLMNLSLQDIPLQDSPTLWSFFRPRSDSFKTNLTTELTRPFKLVKNM